MLRLILPAVLTCLLTSCDFGSPAPSFDAAEALPGGEASVANQPFASFMKPAANLPEPRRPDFHAGKALAHQPWVKAPTATDARDGLGPLFNARTCLSCHANGGRGNMPNDSGTPLSDALVRISLPGHHKQLGVTPEPVYGDQIQTQSVSLTHQLGLAEETLGDTNEAPPEAALSVAWQSRPYTYPSNEHIELRRPDIQIKHPAYGDLPPEILTSLRNAPPIHGVGLLELIPQSDINAHADPDDRDQNGISGKVNQVWDVARGKTVPGRFGWKANRPNNLRIVTAKAFSDDIGITNPLFPESLCTASQPRCLATPNGNDDTGVELPAKLLDLVTFFNRNLGVPKRRDLNNDQVKAGRKWFYSVGCHQCHTPSYTTQPSASNPHLGGQTIWPYTDLLLHDMGPKLADGRPDYQATGSEWRTPPLWGIGLSQAVNGGGNFLHDGRARSIEAAILWHGGEAKASQQAFAGLNPSQRQALVTFVKSL